MGGRKASEMVFMKRILWLYQYDEDYNFDSWFHLDYVRWMSQHDYPIIAYGPNVHLAYNDIAPIEFKKTLSLGELRSLWAYDVIITNTKSRLFYNYSPRQIYNDNCWLPWDFKTIEVPKVMIEEDYQYEDDDGWYQAMGFRLMLQRHYSNSLRQHTIPVQWFPFSVDTKVFRPADEWEQHRGRNAIAFFGHKAHEIYVDRRWACDALNKACEKSKSLLLHEFSENRILAGEDYPNTLRLYSMALVGSGIYNMTFAKLFEIAASGVVPFVNGHPGYGLEKLYPIDCYATYHNDCFDIVEKARRWLASPKLCMDTGHRARIHTEQHHSHEVRTQQLVDILEKL